MGSTLFDFVVVYIGSKLRTGVKSAGYDCFVSIFNMQQHDVV